MLVLSYLSGRTAPNIRGLLVSGYAAQLNATQIVTKALFPAFDALLRLLGVGDRVLRVNHSPVTDSVQCPLLPTRLRQLDIEIERPYSIASP